jgi:hypothetical protein
MDRADLQQVAPYSQLSLVDRFDGSVKFEVSRVRLDPDGRIDGDGATAPGNGHADDARSVGWMIFAHLGGRRLTTRVQMAELNSALARCSERPLPSDTAFFGRSASSTK